MTSKISCFDHAVFRRALKMTAPVWILYALYELLLPLRLFSFCRGLSSGADNYIVQIEKTLLSYARFNASIVPFLLGGLLAWVLFSWLFRAGTAYFYAALPVRRETLFLTNYLTGVLLCAAPALLSSLLLWAVGAGFGAAAFVPAMQVFAAAMLGFLLFFSFAVLVCCVVGQMAAMPIVYVILNFTFFVLEAIVRHLLFTFVYGMPYSQSSTMQSFALHATPVLGLLQGGFRVATDWAERDGMYYMELNPQLEGWGYLGALAALGLVFALCAFLLLKHREMERSGDVIAVGWLRPVALYVFTIGCALVLGALMAELFSSQTADNFWYVLLFLFVGAFVGYFVGKMLLQKTIHVFRSGWLGLGICCLALLLAFGAAEFDLFGYSRYLPERGAVQVDRSCAKLAAARESQLTAARPPENRPQEHYGRPHFPHQIVWYLIAADVGGVHAHRVAAAGTPAPKAGKYPARRVHVGKLRAVMQNAFAVRQHTRRKQRERAVLCSVHPEFALQPPPAVNDELLAVCHMIISSCITVFP